MTQKNSPGDRPTIQCRLYRLKSAAALLPVSAPGYYKYKHRPMAPTQMRRVWLTNLIREVHAATRGTYGSASVHAELTLGMGVRVSEHPTREGKVYCCAVLEAFSGKNYWLVNRHCSRLQPCS
jgi:hypothetical protein